MDLNEMYKKYPSHLIEFAQALDDVFNDVNKELSEKRVDNDLYEKKYK
jgi:hypothetical protein